MLEFTNGALEEYGIPRSALDKLEELYEKHRLKMHGYLLLGGDRVLAERYWAPYDKDRNHRMYSVTKSLVSIAIGLLLKEGKIKLSDRICGYFPEKLPAEGASPWCAEMTIEHLLTMRTCYSATTFKNYPGDDWTESFFRTEPDHVPGTVFCYDTSATHVLTALVEKITGMKLLDYLRSEVLDAIGFSEDAYIIPDPVGVSQGGSGLMCTLRDMAKVAYLCNHMGKIGDTQYIPEEYMCQAIANHVPTDMHMKLDERFGYGYYFWMTREQDGFVLYGMGGQLAVCFPKYDFIYLTIADVIGNPEGLQMVYDCFYQAIYPYLSERRENNPEAFDDKAANICRINEQEAKECTEEIRNKTNQTVYQCYENNMLGWKSVSFDWDAKKITIGLQDREFELVYDEQSGIRQVILDADYSGECVGYWKCAHFMLDMYVTDEEQGHISMDFAWRDSRFTVRAFCTGEAYWGVRKDAFLGFASGECKDVLLSSN